MVILFYLSRRTTVVQDLFVRRQFSLVQDNQTNVIVEACHFQHYFSYIMAVSFIGGGNRSTPVKTTDLSQVTDKFIT